MNKLMILLVLFGITGCTNKAIYEGTRIQQRNDCLKEPPARYEECVERIGESYEEYRREREEMLETPSEGSSSGNQTQ